MMGFGNRDDDKEDDVNKGKCDESETETDVCLQSSAVSRDDVLFQSAD